MTGFDHQSILQRVFAKSGLTASEQTHLVAEHRYYHQIDHSNGRPAIGDGDGEKAAPDMDISEIGPDGLCITQSGHYRLTADIKWTAGPLAWAAICVLADDVIIDLNGHSISVEPVALDSEIATILVGDGLTSYKNITLRNGVLLNAGFRVIWAQKINNITVDNVLISGITFNNINKRNCFAAGIYIDECAEAAITGCTVQYGYVTSDVAGGIVFMHTLGAQVTDCTITNFTNYDGSMQGIAGYASLDLSWTGCTVENLQSFFNGNLRTGGHTVIGYMPTICAGIRVTDCVARNMIGSRDDCHGMSIFICADAQSSGFVADNVVDGPPPYNLGAKATGLEIYGWNIALVDCAVSNIFAHCPQDRQSAGFSVWGNDISVERCNASNVQVYNAAGEPDTSYGYGVGFGWAPDPRPEFRAVPAESIRYSACAAENCQVGFDSWCHIGSTWDDIATPGCDIKLLVQTDPPAERTLFADPISECNPPVTVTLTNLARDNVVKDMLL